MTKMMLTAAMLLGVTGAFAGEIQRTDRIEVRAKMPRGGAVHVPFAFNAAGVDLPASDYAIQAGPFQSQITLTDVRSGQRIAVNKFPAYGQAGRTRMEFERKADRWFLRKVFQNGSEMGAEVIVTKMEREAAAAVKQASAPVPAAE